MKHLTLPLLLLLTLFITPSESGCSIDIECKFDRVCENGKCVPYTPTEVVAEKVKEDRVRNEEVESDVDYSNAEIGDQVIWVNPLGFLQFGPTIGYEHRLGDAFYLGPHFRYAALGLIYNEIVEENDDPEIGMGSAAIGLSGKYYMRFKNHPHSLYYGLFTEFAWGNRKEFESSWDGNDDSSDREFLYEAIHRTLVLGGTLGWRWRIGEDKKTLLSLGVLCGTSRDLKSERTYEEPDSTAQMPLDFQFFGNIEFSMGWEF